MTNAQDQLDDRQQSRLARWLDERWGLRISLGCQWREWWPFSDYNWRNFDLIRAAIECGSYKGRYVEVELALLGLTAMITWNDRLTTAAWLAEMDQRMAEAKESMGLIDED